MAELKASRDKQELSSQESACFECGADTFPPQVTFPMCTLTNTPRLPEHCIEWAHLHQWPEEWGSTKFDADNTEHMKWMHETALKRAAEYNISGVTYRLTQGVVKNIIPAIAATNAVKPTKHSKLPPSAANS
mmetsp:Transcript_16079/g.22348  ORF Transcript_16079/g.22348 Transcript_16079/m.22348 type:complete len:132 (-) Transcript_16079:384-779(-)